MKDRTNEQKNICLLVAEKIIELTQDEGLRQKTAFRFEAAANVFGYFKKNPGKIKNEIGYLRNALKI